MRDKSGSGNLDLQVFVFKDERIEFKDCELKKKDKNKSQVGDSFEK